MMFPITTGVLAVLDGNKESPNVCWVNTNEISRTLHKCKQKDKLKRVRDITQLRDKILKYEKSTYSVNAQEIL